MKGALR